MYQMERNPLLTDSMEGECTMKNNKFRHIIKTGLAITSLFLNPTTFASENVKPTQPENSIKNSETPSNPQEGLEPVRSRSRTQFERPLPRER